MIRFWVGFGVWLRKVEKCKFSGLCAPRVRTLGVDDEKEVGRECFCFLFLFCFFLPSSPRYPG